MPFQDGNPLSSRRQRGVCVAVGTGARIERGLLVVAFAGILGEAETPGST